MSSETDWSSQLRHLVEGDEPAVRDFWNRYGTRLHLLAERHLSPALQRREAPEDVAQSVCRTFFRRARAGQFTLDDSDCLWRLLCAITMAKTREKARYHGRHKRSWKREQSLVTQEDESVAGIPPLASREPDPVDVVILRDELERLTLQLDEEEQTLLAMKLQQCSQREIAEALGCSERTVRRLQQRLQQRLQAVLEESLEE